MHKVVLNETSYHGQGAISAVPEEIKKRGYNKLLVVTDKVLWEAKVTAKVTDLLDAEGITYDVFMDIKPNPTIENVQAGVAKIKEINADCVLAIGGGSSMDTAKAMAVIATNPEFADVRSLEGLSPTTNKCLPILAVTTTAGTASEVTINYVITDAQNKKKLVCVDANDIPEVAFVDPDMTKSMPKPLTAATGMDALTHSIEGYITKGAWEMTNMFHIKAVELISRNLRKAYAGDMEGVEAMALGQYIAGMGFSNAGLGLVHAMSHPLSAFYDTPHGMANAILLPVVMEFNASSTNEKFKDVAIAMGLEGAENMTIEEARVAAVEEVRQLTRDINFPTDLKEIVNPDDLHDLAVQAFNDPCYPGNPINATVEEIIELYKKLM